MWLNITQVKTYPAEAAHMVEILSQEASLAPIQAARGFLRLYLVESTHTPGDLASITVWETPEDGQAYLASPECLGIIDRIRGFLVTPLERHYYEVLIEATNPIPSNIHDD